MAYLDSSSADVIYRYLFEDIFPMSVLPAQSSKSIT